MEKSMTDIVFNSDGTNTREQKTRIRVQSDAGVQQYGILNFPYQGDIEHVDIDYVRVKKPDGTVVVTSPE